MSSKWKHKASGVILIFTLLAANMKFQHWSTEIGEGRRALQHSPLGCNFSTVLKGMSLHQVPSNRCKSFLKFKRLCKLAGDLRVKLQTSSGLTNQSINQLASNPAVACRSVRWRRRWAVALGSHRISIWRWARNLKMCVERQLWVGQLGVSNQGSS